MQLQMNRQYQTKDCRRVTITDVDCDPDGSEFYVGFYLIGLNEYFQDYWREDGRHLSGNDMLNLEEEGVLMKISKETADSISKHLEGVVHRFNVDFAHWMEESGCKANFEWRYDGENLKQLAIKDIDAQIYKKPLPNWASGQKG